MSDSFDRPAFPHQELEASGEHFQTHHGMTLRDYFAGQALANRDLVRLNSHEPDWRYEALAAYEIADAMLAERAK